MDIEQHIVGLLEDILKELKAISEYIGYKKQKEMWERKICRSLPRDRLQLDERTTTLDIQTETKRVSKNRDTQNT